MDVYPLLDIYFGEECGDKLLSAIAALCKSPWSRVASNVFGRCEDRYLNFRRARVAGDPDCILTIYMKGPGHWQVVSIIPEKHEHYEIDQQTYVRILREFNEAVAGPAAENMGGQTVMGSDKHSLSDYFSPEAVDLLKCFCKSANVADRGSSEHDQYRWRKFLIFVHRNNEPVHCDNFRHCLAATGWWPKDGIDELTDQYDFAMSLLNQNGETPSDILRELL